MHAPVFRQLQAVALALATAPVWLAALPWQAASAAAVEVQATGSDGKPLAETVVFLESAQAKAAARPLQAVEIEQDKRRFTQRVTVVTLGSEVAFPNRDTVRHHVYSFSPVKNFELKLYSGKSANPVLFDKPGIAVLGCNIHDNMVAWVVVVETPHHAIADAKGSVRLENVPPGNYRLRSWHPGMPPGAAALDEALVVPAGGASARIKLPLVAASL
jgi:plastocyanin